MRATFLVLLGLLAATFASPAAPASAEAISIMKLMRPARWTIWRSATRPPGDDGGSHVTCPHCAELPSNGSIFDTLKTDDIDTGKVYYVLRGFPLDQLAPAAAMAARWRRRKNSSRSSSIVSRPEAVGLRRQAGAGAGRGTEGPRFHQKSFAACLARTDLAKSMIDVEKRGQDEFGVDGTPAFLINGEMMPARWMSLRWKQSCSRCSPNPSALPPNQAESCRRRRPSRNR